MEVRLHLSKSGDKPRGNRHIPMHLWQSHQHKISLQNFLLCSTNDQALVHTIRSLLLMSGSSLGDIRWHIVGQRTSVRASNTNALLKVVSSSEPSATCINFAQVIPFVPLLLTSDICSLYASTRALGSSLSFFFLNSIGFPPCGRPNTQ